MPPKGTAYQAAGAQRASDAPARTTGGAPPGWPGKDTLGGNVPPARVVYDPHPTFNGMAIDPQNNIVAFSDENQEGLLTYNLSDGSPSKARHAAPHPHHRGERQPRLHRRRDSGSRAPRDVHRQQRRRRARRPLVRRARRRRAGAQADRAAPVVGTLAGPGERRAGGHEPAVSGHHDLPPDGDAAPTVRCGRSAATRRCWRIRTACSWIRRRARCIRRSTATGPRCAPTRRTGLPCSSANTCRAGSRNPRSASTTRPSTATSRRCAPSRVTRRGSRGRWASRVDTASAELAVANYGTNEILIYNKGANGDVAPSRILGGDRTGIVGPIAVQIDPKNNEIWVANYGDHTAVVFDRKAAAATWRRSGSSATHRPARRRRGSPMPRRRRTTACATSCSSRIE